MQIKYNNPSLLKLRQTPEDYTVYMIHKKRNTYKAIQVILLVPFLFQILACIRIGHIGVYLLEEYYQGFQAFWVMMKLTTSILVIPYVIDIWMFIRISSWLRQNKQV